MILNYCIQKPKRIFLVDGIGAAISSISLMILYQYFNSYIGMPVNILKYLATIAICLFMYAMCCASLLRKNFGLFIYAAGILNILYCTLTIGLLIIHKDQITLLGILYFVGEIVLVSLLAILELKLAHTLKE